MKGRPCSDSQFSHILDVLILYKRTCPTKEVTLSEASIQEAVGYFMKSGLFEGKDLKASSLKELSKLADIDSEVVAT